MTDKTLAPCGSDSSKELGGRTCEQGCNGCDGGTDHDEADDWCDVPPLGWRCTRTKGHEGPCAAVECPEDIEFVQRGMDRLREQPNTEVQRRPD